MGDLENIQPVFNLGIVGHVDHGKTTLTKLLSGVWTDKHSEEEKRGITIKLGYTNFTIYQNEGGFTNVCDGAKKVKKISIVDSPGHESFMATMISGAAVMDYALLLVAANENCPKPQTIEHLRALEIAGIEKIIVVQNKIDSISKEEAFENFKQIRTFLEGTKYKNSKIIPLSAEHGANLGFLLKFIVEEFEDKKIDLSSKPLMNIVRSFDINKPGLSFEKIRGGVLGGAILMGKFKVGDEVEIKPGIFKTEGKQVVQTIYAKICEIRSDKEVLKEAFSGGSIAISTELDPSLTKSDVLVGQVMALKGNLGEPSFEISFQSFLFEKVITSTEEVEVKPLYLNEPLFLIVNSYTTVGIVTKINSKNTFVRLKKPIMKFKNDRVIIFRKIQLNKWKIIGYGILD